VGRSDIQTKPLPSGFVSGGEPRIYRMPDPVFILAPGRTFTSVVSAMLGQHPQMFGFPELYLNIADSMRTWWSRCGFGRTTMHHGLLRAVAQLYFNEQSTETVAQANAWLRARFGLTTREVFHELVTKLAPEVAVEKSPMVINSDECLDRLIGFFPNARFIHLTRHPRTTCESVLKFDTGAAVIARFGIAYDFGTEPPTLDPQLWWYESHLRIVNFMKRLPKSQTFFVQGEQLLSEPDRHLERIAKWLHLRTDADAIEQMKHPERSPFACYGPPSAAWGGDHGFFEHPELRPFRGKPQSLDGPLSWRPDRCGFLLEVKALAREFGYQ
jgi:Sulfotransferase family